MALNARRVRCGSALAGGFRTAAGAAAAISLTHSWSGRVAMKSRSSVLNAAPLAHGGPYPECLLETPTSDSCSAKMRTVSDFVMNQFRLSIHLASIESN